MTAQVGEKIIVDGQETWMAFCPPLPIGHPRLVAVGGDRPTSTACWRGYVGTWELRQDRFYLVGVEGDFKLNGDEPIFADWFTGVLRIPKGKILMYVHMGFGSVYEEELHIRITRGVAVRKRLIDNRGKDSDRWVLGARNLPGGENYFSLDAEPRFFQNFAPRCPACLTPSDLPDPDKTFDLLGICPIPDSDFLLWQYKCGACKKVFEGAQWNFIGEPECSGSGEEMLKRFNQDLDDFASAPGEERIIDGRNVEFKGSLDLSIESLKDDDTFDMPANCRNVVVPIKSLSLGRAIKKAALGSPGSAFGCMIGPLDLIASLDLDTNTYNPSFPHAMHLRIADHNSGLPVTGALLHFGVSLVFSFETFKSWPWFHGANVTQCRANTGWAQVHVPWRL
jgi:hypothetical protein